MAGNQELSILAKLFRIAAKTIREIAILRNRKSKELVELADKSDAISSDLERVAGQMSNGSSPDHLS